jgi:hypothetical protein
MKISKTAIATSVLIVIVITVGAVVVTNRSGSKFDIPSTSTVSVPEPDATDIQDVATMNIPTRAAAGSETNAVYTSYSTNEAKGYLMYDAAPDNPAEFTATKDTKGAWKLASFKVLGDTDLN